LFQHWILTEANIDEDQRKSITNDWTGPLSEDRKSLPAEDSWAPSWWHGDEEAAMSSRMTAASLDMARRR
jgi:hypothetical protein